jgi:ribosome-associated protein
MFSSRLYINKFVFGFPIRRIEKNIIKPVKWFTSNGSTEGDFRKSESLSTEKEKSRPRWKSKSGLGRDTSLMQKEFIEKEDIKVEDIMKFLEEERGKNSIVLDLKNKCPFANYMIIVEAVSARHLIGMAESLLKFLKKTCPKKLKTFEMEGKGSKEWIIVSTDDIIVHFFMPEVRELYQLEDLWNSVIQKPEDPNAGLNNVLNYLEEIYSMDSKMKEEES